jgi:hypothetical protein
MATSLLELRADIVTIRSLQKTDVVNKETNALCLRLGGSVLVESGSLARRECSITTHGTIWSS